MTSEHVDDLPAAAIQPLLIKRQEVASQIAQLERQLAGLRSDLMHIDHTLRLIDPAYIPGRKKPRVQFSSVGYFDRGDLSRRIYDALRLSPTITASELADKAMADKQLTDARVRTSFVSRFLSRLSQMAKEGQLVRVREENGFSVSWRLADRPS
jgi:hypothetical protein